MSDPATFVIVVSCLVMAVIAGISGGYIWHVYRQRHEEAVFLTLLVRICLRVSFAATWILVYLALALSGFSFGRPWGAAAIAVPILAMLTVPITVAELWFRERRRAGPVSDGGDAK
jgi:uncharacterized membrane protein YbhN (UPF0104 family)